MKFLDEIKQIKEDEEAAKKDEDMIPSDLRIEEIKFNSPNSGFVSIRYPEFDKPENIVFIIRDGSVELSKTLTNDEDNSTLSDAIYQKYSADNRIIEANKKKIIAIQFKENYSYNTHMYRYTLPAKPLTSSLFWQSAAATARRAPPKQR
jgi:hypothetical protein